MRATRAPDIAMLIHRLDRRAPELVLDLVARFGGRGWRTVVLPDPGRDPAPAPVA